MRILAIDPGPESSGVVIYDSDEHAVELACEMDNGELIGELETAGPGPYTADHLVIEDIVSYGMAVGKSTFETVKWMGRFDYAWAHSGGEHYERPFSYLNRRDIKTVICGGSTYRDPRTGAQVGVKDKHIRAALLERFPATGGGKTPEIGVKANPGPLYGVKGHAFSALAVALAWTDINGTRGNGVASGTDDE